MKNFIKNLLGLTTLEIELTKQLQSLKEDLEIEASIRKELSNKVFTLYKTVETQSKMIENTLSEMRTLEKQRREFQKRESKELWSRLCDL